MRDPYEVLGVKKNADAAAIKGAYRKLAKKLHPDANKNDPKAAQRFAELNAAYEILGTEDKRKAYDRGEIDAEGKPKFHGFEGFGPGGFGRGGAQGPGDFSYESFSFGPEGMRRSSGGQGGPGFADLDELLSGMFGGGYAQRGGRGRGRGGFAPEDVEPGGHDVVAETTISLSESAKGTTRRVQLPTGKEVDVRIPAGLGDGKQIRLKGQGLPGHGGAGDVLITVHVAPHPYFMRDGDDLRVDVPITLYEAVLGGKVRVPTLDGAVEIKVPPGTSSGRTFRVTGKGMPGVGKTGDLYATVKITLPAKEDRELENLMRKWQHERPYDPRGDLK